MEIFKIIAIAIVTCFLAIIVKNIKPEFYIFVVLVGSLLILVLLAKNINTIISSFSNLLQNRLLCDILVRKVEKYMRRFYEAY